MKYAMRLLLLAMTLASGIATATESRPFFTLHRIGKGVWAAVALPHSKAGSNSGFVIGDDSVLVVDSFQDPAAAQALLTVIQRKTPLPVRYVVNTHYHLDHVSGNGVYQAAGAVILAQRNVRAWERSENLKFFGDKITPAQTKMVQSYVLPSIVYREGVELYLGSRKVVVRALPGHTGGDSIVYVPDADVVFTGDLFWDHSLPNLIYANTPAQIETDQILLHDYPRATFVPGHGQIGKAADVEAFRGYLIALRAAISNVQKNGEPGPALQSDVRDKLKPVYGSWNYFDYFIDKNIGQTVAELDGTKRRPVPAP